MVPPIRELPVRIASIASGLTLHQWNCSLLGNRIFEDYTHYRTSGLHPLMIA